MTTATRTYWKGDLAEYTGTSEVMHGATFHELRVLDGHRKGDNVWTQRPPEGWEHEGANEPHCCTTRQTVKRPDIFGNVHDTFQTESELNGYRPEQGRML